MSLNRKIDDALDATVAPGPVVIENDTRRVTLDVVASGPVGLAFSTLTIAALTPEDRTSESLASWAESLAARVTYLMEPLTLLEHDPGAGELVLRSHSPTARGDVRAYYEIRLDRNGTLMLSRVAFDEATRRRRPAPCQMTREVLERLVDDCVASAG
jgi:hypothetical protein